MQLRFQTLEWTAVGVLVEMPVMLSVVRIVKATNSWGRHQRVGSGHRDACRSQTGSRRNI